MGRAQVSVGMRNSLPPMSGDRYKRNRNGCSTGSFARWSVARRGGDCQRARSNGTIRAMNTGNYRNLPKPEFLAVDFYCGAGGTTRGLLDAGGYVIAGIDKDEACRETYRINNRNTMLDCAEPEFIGMDMFPASESYPHGQQEEVWNVLYELIPHYRKIAPDAPLLFAICAPCQSFTKFKQQRMTDERTISRERDRDLLSHSIGFVEAFRPDMIISENVANIGFVWDDFQRNLRNLDYNTGTRKVCASRFGVPQYRRRSILMAVKEKPHSGLNFDLPIPDHDADAPPSPSVREAIECFPSLDAGEKHLSIANHECRNLTEINRQRLMSVEPGQPNFGFAETQFGDLSLPCHRRLAEKGKRGFGDVYTRIHPDRPSPTITTRFHSVSNGRFGHFAPEQVRGLSLREGATLQSFSKDYEFYGDSMDTIAKMIGNAVPPKLSACMAAWLLALWHDGEEPALERQ